MHTIRLSRSIRIIVFLLLAGVTGKADFSPPEAAAKLLPERVGVFKAIGQVRWFHEDGNSFGGTSNVTRDYQSSGGERLIILLYENASDSGAYARLIHETGSVETSSSEGKPELKVVGVGTLGYLAPHGVFFFKGPAYVVVIARDRSTSSETVLNFARQFAETLDRGEGDIPALVKHLPAWESGTVKPAYAVNLPGLKENVPNQPVFEAINFAGGVEAVSANYGPSRLVIVEFNTPQLANDNNRAIAGSIQQLRGQGQPAPSAYRRVGNYAVFVFDAPNEQAANQLIDQVKYQQVVQWLGENPFSYEQATREFTETTLGVFVSVVKASGLALVGCLAVGGFFGALLFGRRRAQQRAVEAYVDSDAMIRLNLDELTPESDPARLLESRH